MDRVYKCPNDDCSFILHYKVKLVAVDDHGFLLEEEKDNEAKKQLRYVMVNHKPHSCLDEKEEYLGTFYSSNQLAPILVKISKNSNLPD